MKALAITSADGGVLLATPDPVERPAPPSTGDAWKDRMRLGDFEGAWKISDEVLRSRTGQPCWDWPRHLQSIWDGRPLAGKRVLIRCYHGLGDTLQFIRFAPLVKAIAREVIVWAQPALIPLLKTAAGIDRLLPLHDGTPEAEYAPEGRAAAIEEALTLVELAPDGFPGENERRRTLVATLVADTSVSAPKRFQLKAASENIDVALNRLLKPEQKLAAFEQVAWGLVKDFPENPEGYESLLRIARDSDDNQARTIATALIASSAPEGVKAGAIRLLQRLELVGKPLRDFLPAGLIVPEQHNAPLCLYTWTARYPQSLDLAGRLRALLPSQTILIAVCVDEEVEHARGVFAERKPPALPLYDPAGLRSAFCQALMLDRPGEVYLIGSDGQIATVAGLKKLLKERAARGGVKP